MHTDLAPIMHAAKMGNWRFVLAALETGASSGSLSPEDVDRVCRRCLHTRSFRALEGWVSSGRAGALPLDWVKEALLGRQDRSAAWLIERADLSSLQEPLRFSRRRDLSFTALAAQQGCVEALDALGARAVLDPTALSLFLLKPNEIAASEVVPRLIALGSCVETLESGVVSALRRTLPSRFAPQTPLQAAVAAGLPRTALALLDAGANPSRPWDQGPGDTVAHTAVQYIHVLYKGNATVPDVEAVLVRLATSPAWWVPNRNGKLPIDGLAGITGRLAEIVRSADAKARLESTPRPSVAAVPRRVRL